MVKPNLPWSNQIVLREYTPDDAAALFVLHASIVPTDAGEMVAWIQRLEEKIDVGGRVFVMVEGQRPIAYAALEPLPGLPGMWDLVGGTGPPWRNQGHASRLLAHVREQLRRTGARSLSVLVNSLEDEVARFLRRRGFEVDHEECLLELSQPGGSDSERPDASVTIVTYERSQAIDRFCALYEDSFSGHPWSQPYSESEVSGSLRSADDLLFLEVNGEAIGMAWLELLPGGRGRIEPFGIAAAWQGRGYGRHLLRASLQRLEERGALRVEVGTWRQNTAALNLYKRAGFKEVANWYYLNLDLMS